MKPKGIFFIVGLPRSRTAWLANFFTYGKSYCYHEAIKTCRTPAQMKQLFENTEAEYVGDSDSALPLFIDEMMAAFPEARLAVIERESESVVRSLKKVFSPISIDYEGLVLGTKRAIDKLKTQYKSHAIVISHRDLNDMATCEKLWKHCAPDLPFHEERWKMLNLLTVEIQLEKYLKAFPPDIAAFNAEIQKRLAAV